LVGLGSQDGGSRGGPTAVGDIHAAVELEEGRKTNGFCNDQSAAEIIDLVVEDARDVGVQVTVPLVRALRRNSTLFLSMDSSSRTRVSPATAKRELDG
jgi:hypothetical protein